MRWPESQTTATVPRMWESVTMNRRSFLKWSTATAAALWLPSSVRPPKEWEVVYTNPYEALAERIFAQLWETWKALESGCAIHGTESGVVSRKVPNEALAVSIERTLQVSVPVVG